MKTTLAQWAQSEVYQKALNDFLNTTVGKAFQDVLETSEPRVGRMDMSPTFAAVELGRGEGYRTALDMIEALRNPPAPTDDSLSSDYSTPSGPNAQ